MNRIFIENMQYIAERGNLKAFFDVRLKVIEGDWVIRSCRIIQQTGQRAWVSMPVVSWTDETGSMRYQTMLELPSGIKLKISQAALEAYYKSQAKAA